nr:RNA-directed DNA polymerase, eukaryota, reverse transcriptase zinc-binding domain protein [Tanacetum cinerariifolium]
MRFVYSASWIRVKKHVGSVSVMGRAWVRLRYRHKLKAWSCQKRSNREFDRKELHDKLIDIDSRLGKGEGLHDDVCNRADVFRKIGEIDLKNSTDMAQKAKIKWGIEGDENSKFFHVGRDVINAVKEFFNSSIFPNGCNPSFIALIPKVLYANLLNDFCPISLIGCKYKIIGKILATRLSLVIDKIVSIEQSTFIKGRQIFYGPLIFNEGLRQGDPLSLFLFILVMEILHVSFQRVIDKGMFSLTSIIIGTNETVSISHLFYADDAMFIGKWSSSNANVLFMILHCFFLASRLKININKSSIYGLGVNSSEISLMADRLGCMANKLPFTYLGVKVGANMAHIRALPTYYMLLFRVPDGVLNQLERLRNSFFFGVDIGLWLDVIKVIHVSNGAHDQPLPNYLGSSVRNMVRKAIGNLKSKNVDLMKFCQKVIGNGYSTSFCHEKWLGEECFKVRFNRLRPRGGIEECQWIEFSQLLSSVVLSSASDHWSWSLNGDGVFSIKSAREVIDNHVLANSTSTTRWSKLLHIKVNVFAWRMFLDKLSTRLCLSNRGIDIPCVLCPICEAEVESRDHLFFGCTMAVDLFRLIACKNRRWKLYSSPCGGTFGLIEMLFDFR